MSVSGRFSRIPGPLPRNCRQIGQGTPSVLCVAKLRNACFAEVTHITIATQRKKCCTAGEGRTWMGRAMIAALAHQDRTRI